MKSQENSDVLRITDRLGSRYGGKYVGVVENRVVSSGKDQLNVFRKATKANPHKKEIGIYYIPSKSDRPMILNLVTQVTRA